MNIVPLEADIYWVGSSYEWQFDHDKPTEKFRLQTSAWLKQWLRVPFRVIDHRSAVRPATIERRPFIGFHPLYKNAGLFNGMGTKGCTLAPFFAHQFSALAETGRPLHPEADIARFKNILSKPLKG